VLSSVWDDVEVLVTKRARDAVTAVVAGANLGETARTDLELILEEGSSAVVADFVALGAPGAAVLLGRRGNQALMQSQGQAADEAGEMPMALGCDRARAASRVLATRLPPCWTV